MAYPNTTKEVTGFETPSTFTSKLDSGAGLVVSTPQAQRKDSFPSLYFAEGTGNAAAFADPVDSGNGAIVTMVAMRAPTSARAERELKDFNT